jgi:hypothetical protein
MMGDCINYKGLYCDVDQTNLANKLINQFIAQFSALQSRYPKVVSLVLFIVTNLQKYVEKLSPNNDTDNCDDNNNNENSDELMMSMAPKICQISTL